MSEKNNVKSKNVINAIVLVLIAALVVNFVANNTKTSISIFLSLVGLGIIIFIHEFGHFIAGKLSNINVEMFALGFGPILFGIKRLENGLRIRVLPTMFLKDNDPDGQGLLCFTIPGKFKAGETEYQIRLVPVGGFVKLTGQEDAGADKPSDDPRSFVNAPIWKRICVGSAGVALNVVLAIVLFVVVYTVGINFPPAVVGGVIDGYPADEAGLVAGDEVIEINGKAGRLSFTDIMAAGAFCGKDQSVSMKVKRRDGTIENFSIPVKESPVLGAGVFGISSASSLEVAKGNDNEFFETTGISAGDKLIAINGKPVENFWQFSEITEKVFSPTLGLTFECKDGLEPVSCDVEMQYQAAYRYKDANDFVPASVYGLVPRLKIVGVVPDVNDRLAANDIIIKLAGLPVANYKQFRELTEANVGKDIPIRVLRGDEVVNVKVMPKLDEDGRGVIGVFVIADVEHPVVASLVDSNNSAIPAGAEIKMIDGHPIESFFDIANAFKGSAGKRVKIAYRENGKAVSVDFTVATSGGIKMKGLPVYDIPFEPLKKLYKTSGPIDAAKMGCRKTVSFIMQSYMTIKGLIVREISPKSLMGPVGMIHASSKIIGAKKFLQYVHFMAIISACLAVVNFLPLPILDGGLVVLLIIEKIKGSPVHTKVQEIITYIGLALIGVLFIVITYNDIVRLIKSLL